MMPARAPHLLMMVALSMPAAASELRVEALEMGTQRPVPSLRLVIADQLVRTGDDGVVQMDLAPGSVAIRGVDPGFRVTATTVQLGTQPLTTTLWVVRVPGAEVVGTYRRRAAEGPARVIRAEEIRTLPGSLNDPVRALQSLPGTARAPFDAGWLLVRGAGPDDTGLFLDGVRIPALFHLGGAVSILPPGLVDEVRLSINDSPARLGRSLSGVADLIPRRLDDVEQTRVNTGANLIFAEASVEAPVANGGVAVGVRRSYLDGVLALALDPQAAQIAPRFSDASLRWDTERSGLTLVAVQDGLNAPDSEGGTLEARQRALQLQAWVAPSAHSRLTGWARTGARSIGLLPDTQRIGANSVGLRSELSARSRRWQSRGGVETELTAYQLDQGFTQLQLAPDANDLGDTVARTKLAARQGTTLFIDPYLDLATVGLRNMHLGLRADTLLVPGQLPRAGLSPRWGLTWPLSPSLDVQLEASRSHQAPASLLLLGYPEGTYLPLEQSDQGSIGPRLHSGPLTFEVDTYLRRSRRLAAFERDGTLGQLNGSAWGLETWTQLDLGRHRLRMIYQYTRSLVQEEAYLPLAPTPYEQPHRFELISVSPLPRELTLSTRLRASSGFPAPEEHVAYDLLQQRERYARVRDGRLDPYYAVDIKVVRRFSFRSWRLDASLDLQNLTNRRVPEPVINGVDESRAGLGYGLPVLPVFGLDAAAWPPSSRHARERATTSR